MIGLNRGQIYEFSGLFVPGADKNIVAAKTAIFGVLLPKCSRASAAFCEFSVGSPLTSRILSWGRPSRDNSPQPEPQVTGAPLTTNLSDEQLLLRLRTQDEAAISELFDRHARLVFGIAFRVLQDRGEAEELVQELFLHLVGSAERFDPAKSPARSWISHLAVHKSLDRRSFLQRRRFYDGTDLEVVEDTLHGDEDVEGALIRDSLAGQMRQALEELAPKQRITLEWFFFEGSSLREISERLGETHTNVRHHFYRGLERLRRSPIIVRLKGESAEC